MTTEGVINILKAPGLTSSDVVCDVRHALHIKRVGHTGTLDPGAAGVLPICIGRATRLFDYLVDKDKEYFFEMTFNTLTDTLDAYGIVTEHDDAVIDAAQLKSVLPKFTGVITQVPPLFSAVNHNGRKLYSFARHGGDIEAALKDKARSATIYALDFVRQTASNAFMLYVKCSRGTYVRTLCADIAGELNTVAYVSYLLRVSSGRFKIDDAITIAQLNELASAGDVDGVITPVDTAVDFLGEIHVDGNDFLKKLLINGGEITVQGRENGVYRVYADAEFIGIGEMRGDKLHIKTLFA